MMSTILNEAGKHCPTKGAIVLQSPEDGGTSIIEPGFDDERIEFVPEDEGSILLQTVECCGENIVAEEPTLTLEATSMVAGG